MKINLSAKNSPPPVARKIFSLFNRVWFLWILCIVINIITFLFVYYKIHPSNKTLALHYNVLTGVDWYGKGKNLYTLPAVGSAVTGINFLLYFFLRKHAGFMAELCSFASLSVGVILLFGALFLSRVNV